LHEYNIQWLKVVCFKGVNSVDTGQQGLVTGFLYVVNVRVQHAQQLFLFLLRHCFYQETVIIGKKEEAARGASTLPSLEDPIVVILNVQRLVQVLWLYIVHLQNFGKNILSMRDDTAFDLNILNFDSVSGLLQARLEIFAKPHFCIYRDALGRRANQRPTMLISHLDLLYFYFVKAVFTKAANAGQDQVNVLHVDCRVQKGGQWLF
jgi:hypothetical protein